MCVCVHVRACICSAYLFTYIQRAHMFVRTPSSLVLSPCSLMFLGAKVKPHLGGLPFTHRISSPTAHLVIDGYLLIAIVQRFHCHLLLVRAARPTLVGWTPRTHLASRKFAGPCPPEPARTVIYSTSAAACSSLAMDLVNQLTWQS